MHFTIPYTEEVTDSNGKKVDIFKVYINGAHHCSARYSRFYQLYEDLKLRFNIEDLPYFPPKKILKLNESQLEDRREYLEFFLQKISSSSKLNSSELHEFLKVCQRETKKIVNESVKIPIYLMDGKRYDLDIIATDNANAVYESFACLVNLPRKISSKFGLFLMTIHSDKQISIVRKIQEFEYPYVSLQEIRKNNDCRIVVRKNLWNVELESDIDSNSVGLEILYTQVSTEILLGWISIPDEVRRNRIYNLIDRKARKETLQLARTLDFYGYIQLYGTTLCSRPSSNTEAIVSAGNFELVFRDKKNLVLEKYSLTRIKAWKICTALKENINIEGNSLQNNHAATLTFEYLDLETKRLDEVTISSNQTDQIILLSMSLKSMAEEYVSHKSGASFSEDSIDLNKNKSAYDVEYRSGFIYNYYIGDGDL